MNDLSTIIAEWREKGSEGPWTLEREYGDTYLRDANGCLIMHDVEFYPQPVTNEADWHFIHAAPAMADRIKALEAENAKLQAALGPEHEKNGKRETESETDDVPKP